jgi:Zn-dependent peptidase ImmA (M78 family)
MSVRYLTREEKIELAREAMQATINVRFQLGVGLEEPICTYSACERLGVPVRFVDISMEGIYSHMPLPRILLSAFRPLVRRQFNCAHELGHHVFGHRSKVDELLETLEEYDDHSPEEFIVNSFAGHLLMPVLGIRRAFARRGIEAASAHPHQMLAIASEFGVSYDALATQLTFCLNEISPGRRKELIRARPVLQRAMVAANDGRGLAFLDDQYSASTLDVEENYLIVAPKGTVASNHCAVSLGNCQFGEIFKVVKPGNVEMFVPSTSWTVSIRSTRQNFVGLARYRYLEDDE